MEKSSSSKAHHRLVVLLLGAHGLSTSTLLGQYIQLLVDDAGFMVQPSLSLLQGLQPFAGGHLSDQVYE